jgi:hypothetical protein
MEEITERVTCEDPRAGAFLNEVKVVLTLARNNNDPTYVAKIVDLPPKIPSIRGGDVEATKPGIKSACERLTDSKILISQSMSAPKRRQKGTPHYSIIHSLDTLFLILDRLGPGVLNSVRDSNFGASVITADIYRYLGKQLGVNEEQIMAFRSDLEATIFLVKNSNKALAFLLTYSRPMAVTAEESRSFDLEETILKLRDVAHFAFLFDMAASRVTVKGLQIEARVSSNISYGSMRIPITSHLSLE